MAMDENHDNNDINKIKFPIGFDFVVLLGHHLIERSIITKKKKKLAGGRLVEFEFIVLYLARHAISAKFDPVALVTEMCCLEC